MNIPLVAPPLADGPDLRSYDRIVVAISGGKDSMAALYETVAACGRAGVWAGRVVAVHADLGEVEWPGVPALAEEHARRAGVDFRLTQRHGRIVQREGKCYAKGERYGSILDHAQRMGHWPKPKSRYCTSDHKRDPIIRSMRAIARDAMRRVTGRPLRVLNVMGMRAAESRRRAAMPPFRLQVKRSSSQGVHVDEWLPIHAWSDSDVWRRVWSSGWPWHEAYDWGMPRLSCSFCILSSKAALRLATFLRPEVARKYALVEDAIDETLTTNTAIGELLRDLQGPLEYARAHGLESIAGWNG